MHISRVAKSPSDIFPRLTGDSPSLLPQSPSHATTEPALAPLYKNSITISGRLLQKPNVHGDGDEEILQTKVAFSAPHGVPGLAESQISIITTEDEARDALRFGRIGDIFTISGELYVPALTADCDAITPVLFASRAELSRSN